VTIFQNTTLGAKFSDFVYKPEARPKIGSEVVIGAGVSVLGPVRVGNNAVLAANSLVLEDVAPNTTVIGVPAREFNTNPD
jgi:serine O-acetyltransferase